MYIYKAKQKDTYQIVTKNFPSYREAAEYAMAHTNDHVDSRIDSLFTNMDGIIIEKDIETPEEENGEEEQPK